MASCSVQPDNCISVWDEAREDTSINTVKDWKMGVEKMCRMRKSESQKQQL